MPVPMSTKRQALADVIRSAATQHVGHGINIEQRHRLVSEFGAVSRRDRRKVMVPSNTDTTFYCELINGAQQTLRQDTGGAAQEVGHAFNVWLVYGYEDSASSSTWDKITEGHNPHGVTRELRQKEGYFPTPDGKILYQQPDFTYDIIPLGTNGGGFDSAHVLQGTIRIDDFNR